MRISSLPNSSLMILVRLLPDLKDLRLSKSVIISILQRFTGQDGRTVMLLRTTDLLDGSKYEAKKYCLGAFAQGSLVEVDNGDGTTSLAWISFFRDTYPTGRISRFDSCNVG